MNLPSGKKIQVPFDQLIIFSTNLEPKDLVDDAFLRRIPYKIEVGNPSEKSVPGHLRVYGSNLGFTYDQDAVDYVIQEHYYNVDRTFRCCHPRDLMLQVKNYCTFKGTEKELTPGRIRFCCRKLLLGDVNSKRVNEFLKSLRLDQFV